ncbi:hypothetical protein AVEN_29472-1 [Araneus ventricosus]|uniref:Snake toxin/toxin-like domain-containing protein n=1 Tax=Araneus ventricosus TaxID=182803 RepID=A0A4Y2QUI2_ARAVE|nr:hypothetical protein AVEN_29472-1 [Araneus ventricosus]
MQKVLIPVWILLMIFLDFDQTAVAVNCYTCNVDFRKEPFTQNHSCIFPNELNSKVTECSGGSKFCKGVITRINGVFVQLQRTCETDCQETCTEKGYGIQTRECRFCCSKAPDCGKEGYKSSAPSLKHAGWPLLLLLLYALIT